MVGGGRASVRSLAGVELIKRVGLFLVDGLLNFLRLVETK